MGTVLSEVSMKPTDSMRRRMECPALPRGWVREEVLRTGGLSAGKFDVYYYPPGGKLKCRSKPEMVKVLGNSIDLSNFDYTQGRLHLIHHQAAGEQTEAEPGPT